MPLEPTCDGKWKLHSDYQQKWLIVEQSLLYIITKFRETFHSLHSLNYKPYCNPSDHGYLQSHKEAKHARISATQSRLTFLPLIGRVSCELSRKETHIWEKPLLTDNGQAVCLGWIKAMKTCAICNFSLSIHWVGALINLGSANSDILEMVPCMLKCNVPIWFFWGCHTSPHPLSGGPFIDQYCPNQDEIKEALIVRQITVSPIPTPDPIFPHTEDIVPSPSVDPILAALSSQTVSLSASLTQILFLTLIHFAATVCNPIYCC